MCWEDSMSGVESLHFPKLYHPLSASRAKGHVPAKPGSLVSPLPALDCVHQPGQQCCSLKLDVLLTQCLTTAPPLPAPARQ